MSSTPSAGTSSAIQIKSPTSVDAQGANSRRSTDSGSQPQQGQRQCRNVLIYGNCKYEGKGCTFYHPPRQGADFETQTEPPRVASPISIQHLNAPEFVPGAISHLINGTQPPPPTFEASGVSEDHQSSHYLGNDAFLAQSDDQYYPQPNVGPMYPLSYHLYNKSTAPQPDLSGHHHGFFVSDTVREDLQKRSEDIWAIPKDLLALPDEVHSYHSLSPLEALGLDRRKYFGHWTTACYRATSSLDGSVYALRRIENFRLAHESAFSTIEPWRSLSHPNIVRLREAFTTRAFNDSSLVLAYDYHPLAATLFEKYLRTKPEPPYHNRGEKVEYLPEETVWSFIIQIANAMKAVHDRGLALRVIDATKILLTEKSRVRINCCGMSDLVNPDPHDVAAHQQEDMVSFGRLVLSLCVKSVDISNYAKTRDIVSRHYSTDLQNAIMFLISPQGAQKVIGKLFDFIGSRLLLEMDAIQTRADGLEAQLACELENGRLVRLLSKLGFINERPEFARDFRWSETGDKYIVKLFRDYVFHGIDEGGRPMISLSHVLSNLNKLDAGSDEKLMLVSRDDQSCLVVSYREIKRCVEAAFRELASA